MSRVPLVDIERLDGPVGDALRARPDKINIVSMMAHAEGCVLQQLQLGRAVNSEQDLDPLSRELLILLAAHLDEGQYVWRQHVPIAIKHGVTPAQIDALRQGDVMSPAFSADERALLAYGHSVIRGGHVDDPTFRAVARRYSRRELVEAILAVGYYMTMNRLTAATQTPLESGEFNQAGSARAAPAN